DGGRSTEEPQNRAGLAAAEVDAAHSGMFERGDVRKRPPSPPPVDAGGGSRRSGFRGAAVSSLLGFPWSSCSPAARVPPCVAGPAAPVGQGRPTRGATRPDARLAVVIRRQRSAWAARGDVLGRPTAPRKCPEVPQR